MTIAGIIVAAGISERFAGDVPKQLLPVGGVPMVTWSARVLGGVCDTVVVAAPPGREDDVRAALGEVAVHAVVPGGATRQESVFNALEALPAGTARVLIHDAARPCVSASLVRVVVGALEAGAPAVVPVVPAVDTLVRAVDGRVEAILDRAHVCGVQTPQGFHLDLIVEAHRRARARGYRSSDDGSLVLALGERLSTVPGERTNIKVTFPEDIGVAGIILAKG